MNRILHSLGSNIGHTPTSYTKVKAMIRTPPKVSALLAWSQAIAWVAVIYTSIFFARRVQAFVVANVGREGFYFFVVLFGVITLAYIARHLYRYRKEYSWLNYFTIVVVFSLYLFRTTQLKKSAPEEALHFVQYGILYCLILRALVCRYRHVAVIALALVLTSLFGNLDEVVQWFAPERYFDWRDVGLNAFSGLMASILFAFAFRPQYLSWARDKLPVKELVFALILHLSLSVACLLNFPSSLADNFGFVSSGNKVISEYGYLIKFENISFKSRLPAEVLLVEDEKKGELLADELAGKVLDHYPSLLKQFSETIKPFEHEIVVRTHRIENAIKRNDAEVIFYERRILRKYFPKFESRYFGAASEFREQSLSSSTYESPVSWGVITGFSKISISVLYCLSLVTLCLPLFLLRSRK